MIETVARPIVKWTGGKQSLAEELVRRFPEFHGCYYEPFVGGASVALSLSPSRAVVGDYNQWLTDTYRAVVDAPQRVASILDLLENTKEEYYKNRDINPFSVDLYTRAAMFIYLNKTCFRGLYRVNKKNRFNVPYGAYDRRYYDIDNFNSFSEIASDWEIRTGDFAENIDGIKYGDFVYFDPPYYKLGGYSDFNRYTDGKFQEHDHIRLADVCKELDKSGIKFALSNSNTGFIRELYRVFHIQEIVNRREINLNSENRSITELFISNY